MKRSAGMLLALIARSIRPVGRRLGGDEQNGLVEAGIVKRLLDVLRELEIEGVFGNAARAHGAGHGDGVADIDHDTECRTLAACALPVLPGAGGSWPRAGLPVGREHRQQTSRGWRNRHMPACRKQIMTRANPHVRLHAVFMRTRRTIRGYCRSARNPHPCARRAPVVPNRSGSVGWVELSMGKFVGVCVMRLRACGRRLLS